MVGCGGEDEGALPVPGPSPTPSDLRQGGGSQNRHPAHGAYSHCQVPQGGGASQGI